MTTFLFYLFFYIGSLSNYEYYMSLCTLDTVTGTILGWSRLIRHLKDLDGHYCITLPYSSGGHNLLLRPLSLNSTGSSRWSRPRHKMRITSTVL
jgi:hypothetical protein